MARQAVAETEHAESPASAYVRALALVCLDEVPDVAAMLDAGGAFERTGRALAALAAGDPAAYRAAIAEIVADFEGRDQHLSGVAVADTVLVLERLAEPRHMAVRPATRSSLKHRCLMPMFHGFGPRGRRLYSGRPGAIAQLGERHAGSVEVDGSSPSSSTSPVCSETSRVAVGAADRCLVCGS